MGFDLGRMVGSVLVLVLVGYVILGFFLIPALRTHRASIGIGVAAFVTAFLAFGAYRVNGSLALAISSWLISTAFLYWRASSGKTE